jgi:hypothetical protein
MIFEIRNWKFVKIPSREGWFRRGIGVCYVYDKKTPPLWRHFCLNLFFHKYRFYRTLISRVHRTFMVLADHDRFSQFIQLESVGTNFGTAAATDAFISVNFDDHNCLIN